MTYFDALETRSADARAADLATQLPARIARAKGAAGFAALFGQATAAPAATAADRAALMLPIQQALQRANVTLVGSGNARQRTPANTMVLTVQADTRPGGSGQGFTTVYLDLVGTVTDASGATIFTQTKTNIKGIQLDLPRATDVAYDKGRVLMEEEFIPQLVRLWHGF